jgi:peptidoglycan hydrolase-like protein with peptidoglycan-binding domain
MRPFTPPVVVVALVAAVAAPAAAAGDPAVAAVQLQLRQRGLYAGQLDGVRGPATDRAVRAAQVRAGIAVDGVVGPQTRRVLQLRPFGSRVLRTGSRGADVFELQFALAEHGFPSGALDGIFGGHTRRALRGFQRFAGIAVDGVVGSATVHALQTPPPRIPFALARPLDAPVTDGFGPRGLRFHAGLDLPAPSGTGVAAAAPGRVSYAGWLAGGWGRLVVVAHRAGVRSLYAHLSRIDVRVGEQVEAGFQLGLVGATGDASGPHLHFEVRVRGAAVDPLPALARP